jgi:flagellar biosynthesis protein FliP
MTLSYQRPTNLVLRSGLALSLALAICVPVRAQAADAAESKQKMGGKMMVDCQDVMLQHQKMMREMKAQDAELTERIAKLHSAPEDKKMELMAGILARMVEQRAAMNALMEAMQGQMVEHAMAHMRMGKESMAQCPMKDAKGMNEKMGGPDKPMMKDAKDLSNHSSGGDK